MRKLVIISHTPHQICDNKVVVGWGPTIKEINHLAKHWEKVVHVGCLEKGSGEPSYSSYSQNVEFVPIPVSGGKSVLNKIMILRHVPNIIFKVHKATKDATHVQLRLPTGIGVFVLPFLVLLRYFREYVMWIKYATNWNSKHLTLGPAFQRWFISNNFAQCPVTINGNWENQPDHCISFENPCLTIAEVSEGMTFKSQKQNLPPYNLLFIGRLEPDKGVMTLLESLSKIPSSLINLISIIGDGPLKDSVIEVTKNFSHKVVLYGALPRDMVFSILKESHFICLPSKSEGFPKVLAEAACWGCIPICSSVGSIPQYIIDRKTGFLWDRDSTVTYSDVMLNALTTDPSLLLSIKNNLSQIAGLFTYERYIEKIKYLVCKQ